MAKCMQNVCSKVLKVTGAVISDTKML